MKARPSLEDSSSGLAPAGYLSALGRKGDGPHDIAVAALMLAALDHPEKPLAPFLAHLVELGQAADSRAGGLSDAGTAARALGSVLTGQYGYDGDRTNYDDPSNADLISVIERRKGLPVALGVLYIHAARAAGFKACGLFAPGHFLLKIAVKRSEALIDPFNAQTAIDRERFTAPAYAEAPSPGEPDPFEPVSDTEVLLRLQNNVRSRALERRDMARAIEIGKRMLMLAPKRGALWLELGHLQERTGSLSAARQSYENCLKVAPQGDSFHNEALVALSTLKRRLN